MANRMQFWFVGWISVSKISTIAQFLITDPSQLAKNYVYNPF
jgi:hypothetical protein